jgi:elongation factor G
MSKSIAILAHVDAGKTTLSERILYLSKEIDTVGEVEEGLATMDYLPTEKAKGITIEAGVSSYTWKGEAVDFLDTPGHIDFSAEVDCALYAAQGAVLVICGQSSFETQTIAAWRKIREHDIVPIIFINKLDIIHADLGTVLIHIEEQIDRRPIVLNLPVYNEGALCGVFDLINNVTVYSGLGRAIKVAPEFPEGMEAEVKRYRKELIEALAGFSDPFMEKYLLDEPITPEDIIPLLSMCFSSNTYIAVCLGAAKQAIGVRQLLNAVHTVIPKFSTLQKGVCAVIKVRSFSGKGIVYIAQAHAEVAVANIGIDSIYSIRGEELVEAAKIESGEIFAFTSNNEHRIGDVLDENGVTIENVFKHVYNPLVMVQIEAKSSEDMDAINSALAAIEKTDPALKVKPDFSRGCWHIYITGEVHRDYICDRLEKEYKCAFVCGEPQVQYFEELTKDLALSTEKSEFFGKILSLTMEVRKLHGKYVTYEIENIDQYPEFVEGLVKNSVDEIISEGIMGKGELRCAHFVIKSIESTDEIVPGQLKKLISDWFRLRINESAIKITEPIMEFEVSVPDEFCGKIASDLKSRGAEIQKLANNGVTNKIIGEIPLTETFGYSIIARTLTKGTASYALCYKKHY